MTTHPRAAGSTPYAQPASARAFAHACTVRAVFAAAVAMTLAAAANAWMYSAAAAGPLVQADAWYFLDVFLSKYFDGSLRVSDLFVQREPGDHSQPLNKLVLLFHARYFDLDFRVEGLIGVAAGIAWCSLLAWRLWRAGAALPAAHPAAPLAIALVFLLGLSLNGSNIFTWSLVTLSYLPLLVGTAFFFALQRWGAGPRFWLMAPAAFLLGMTLDEVAIVVVAAALVPFWLLTAAPRRRKLWTSGIVIASLVIARVLLWYLSLRGWHGDVPQTPSLASVLFSREALRGLLIPFGDGLIYVEHLQRLFGERATQASIAVALGVLLLHAWFWVRAIGAFFTVRSTGVHVPTVALAVFLMLVSYALIAGIVQGRVPAFGWGYLHQPRYILYYQLGLVAIAVMFHARLIGAVGRPGPVLARIEPMAIVAVVLALAMVQVVVSRANWGLPRYLTPYWQNAALSMQKLAEDPGTPPQCPDIMSVCNDYDAAGRARLMGLLVQHQLNIFSPGFQMRNRLYPTLHSIPGFAPAPEAGGADPDEAALPRVDIEIVRLADGCVASGARAPVRIRLDAGELPAQELQLWVDAIGAPRTRLAPLESQDGTIELQSELLPGSVLGVVRGGDQRLLARQDFEAPACAATAD